MPNLASQLASAIKVQINGPSNKPADAHLFHRNPSGNVLDPQLASHQGKQAGLVEHLKVNPSTYSDAYVMLNNWPTFLCGFAARRLC